MTRMQSGALGLVVVGVALVVIGVPCAVAQTDVINVVNNNVGIGTSTPTKPLHVVVSGTYDPVLMLQGSNATDSLTLKVQHTNGVVGFGIAGATSAFFTTAHQHDAVVFGQPGFNLLLGVGGSEWIRITNAGKIGINNTSPTHLLDVGVSGAYCNGGAWVDGSSREYKQGIQELSTEAAEEAFAQLNPVTFEYKAMPGEGHVGFVAEDVPALVATPDRKGLSAMEVVAVLTKVVQEQKSVLEQQQRAIAELQAQVAELRNKQ